jgi:RimJ/RimL family protein N-acetyltransferase
MAVPTLITHRLILRGFTEADVDPMEQIMAGKDVMRYFPRSDPPDRERVAQMIARIIGHWEEFGYGLWAVQAQISNVLMGRCGLQLIPDTGEVEIDFLLGRLFWGKGFASEAGRASLNYGFEELALNKIVGIIHPENIASRRVLEKLGLRFSETANYFGMAVFRYCLEHPVKSSEKQTQL